MVALEQRTEATDRSARPCLSRKVLDQTFQLLRWLLLLRVLLLLLLLLLLLSSGSGTRGHGVARRCSHRQSMTVEAMSSRVIASRCTASTRRCAAEDGITEAPEVITARTECVRGRP